MLDAVIGAENRVPMGPRAPFWRRMCDLAQSGIRPCDRTVGAHRARIRFDAPVIEIRPGLVLPDSCLEWRASRAGGPGGQHVNTTSTQVELRLAIDACDMLSSRVRARLRTLGGSRVSNDGVLRLVCGSSRSQLSNRDECEQRLRALILEALKPPPPPRKKTKPSRRAKQRRLDAKKQRGALKRNRKRGRDDD